MGVLNDPDGLEMLAAAGIPVPGLSLLRSEMSAILVMATGDSQTTGSGVGGPGASRAALMTLARADGLNVHLMGTVPNMAAYDVLAGTGNATPATVPYEAWCAGYPGKKIEDITAHFGGAPTGAVSTPLIAQFIARSGAPNVIPLMIGTNNAFPGDDALTMIAKLTTLLAQIRATCPDAHILVETIPHAYAPATPTNGLSATNAVIDAFNAWILSSAELLDKKYHAVDVASQITQDCMYTDGTHLNEKGQAIKGKLEYLEIARIFPQRRGSRMPRRLKPRKQQASVSLPTKGTSRLTTSQDNGWRLPAGSGAAGRYLLGGRIVMRDYAASTNYVITSYDDNVNHGVAIVYDGTNNGWVVYVMGVALMLVQMPALIGVPIWVYAHLDPVNTTCTLWIGMPRNIAQPDEYVVVEVGAAIGVTPWAQGNVNPSLSVGTDPFGRAGAALDVDSVVCAQGASIPDVWHVGEVIEAIVFDGTTPPAITGSLPCTEGSGTSVASGIAGSAATITSGGWDSPGEILWPSDSDVTTSPYMLATVAMSDADTALPSTAYNATTIEVTGALTADRALTGVPRRRGRVLTINNKTTGAHNVVPKGASGTGPNCAAGISRVYFDGTNFVAA